MIATDYTDPLNDVPKCKNCQSPMWEGDLYCADCGQKKTANTPAVWQLFSDFFDAVFSLDNRLFRTLFALFVPGRLTNYYLVGKRQPYFNPLRAFFFSAVIMVAAFTYAMGNLYGDYLDNAQKQRFGQAYHQIFKERLEQEIDTVLLEYPTQETTLAMDSLKSRMIKGGVDSVGLLYINYGAGTTFSVEQIKFPMKDIISLSAKELLDKHEVNDWLNRYQMTQLLRVQAADARGVFIMASQIIWGLLFLVPICALIMKLFYSRGKQHYIGHLIFSLHVHAFICLVLAIANTILYFTGNADFYIVCIVSSALYFVVALKTVYKQTWIKTLVKSFIMSLFYLLAINLCALFFLVISILLF